MQNATQMSVERCFFHASVNPRFMSEAWPMLRLQPGDLLSSEATSYKTGRKKMPGMVVDTPSLRPAGHLSDFRMVASMLALRLTHNGGEFQGHGGTWLGELFELGHVYRDRMSNYVMLCLGFHSYVAFMFRVAELDHGFFKVCEKGCPLEDAISRFQPVCLTDIERKEQELEGIWTAIPCSICLPSDIPGDLHESGLLLKRTGEEMGLVTYRLLHGAAMSLNMISRLCFILRLPVELACNEKSVGPKMAVVRHFCTHLTEDAMKALVESMTKKSDSDDTSKRLQKDARVPDCLHAVLKVLSAEEDFTRFEDLKSKMDDEKRLDLIIRREGYHHSKASKFTPKLITDLRPPGLGIYLNMQPTLNQFAGYYEKPTAATSSKDSKGSKVKKQRVTRGGNMHTTARKWGGKWSQGDALALVVSQLWAWHKNMAMFPGY
ncbi:unnamed protein product, partial [Cladocopium goreaui]